MCKKILCPVCGQRLFDEGKDDHFELRLLKWGNASSRAVMVADPPGPYWHSEIRSKCSKCGCTWGLRNVKKR